MNNNNLSDLVKKIRLSESDLNEIQKLFLKHFISGDKLWIFGSRVDLTKKGGDIDLYIETQASTIEDAIKMKTNFIWDLEQKIGEQKIDVILNILKTNYTSPIYNVALSEGLRII